MIDDVGCLKKTSSDAFIGTIIRYNNTTILHPAAVVTTSLGCEKIKKREREREKKKRKIHRLKLQRRDKP